MKTSLGKNIIKFILILACALLALTACVNNGDEPNTDNGKEVFEYKKYDNSCILVKVNDKQIANADIPDFVTKIGSEAFFQCALLTSVTIPDSVTEIGAGAFDRCGSLESIVIPKSVKNIGAGVFAGCDKLENITVEDGNTVYRSENNCLIETETKTLIAGCKKSVIPTDGSVTKIGSNAFASLKSLEFVNIPEGVTDIGRLAFYDCDGLTEVVIPKGANIEESVFAFCDNLKSVTLPSADYLEKMDFDFVTRLEKITLTGGESLADNTFKNCKSLKSVALPDTVTDISRGAFFGGSITPEYRPLSSITVSEGNPKYHSEGNCLIETQEKKLILGCKASVIPSDGSVENIGYYAFAYCDFTGIVIPESVSNIDKNAFYGCEKLVNMTLPYADFLSDAVLKSVLGVPLNLKSYLKEITLTSGEEIGASLMESCANLGKITLPDSLISIGENAFKGCVGLTAIDIPKKLANLGNCAFEGCTGLESITADEENAVFYAKNNCLIEAASKTLALGCKTSVIPSDGSVTAIGKAAFKGCAGLAEMVVPQQVTEVGEAAFGGCDGLKSLTVPFGGIVDNAELRSLGGLKNITVTGGDALCARAFASCNKLESVTLPDSIINIEDEAFYYCGSLKSIELPDGVVSFGDRIFEGCSNLEAINIPKNVADLGIHAFDGCLKLTSVNLPSGLEKIGAFTFNGCSALKSIAIPDGVKEIGRAHV